MKKRVFCLLLGGVMALSISAAAISAGAEELVEGKFPETKTITVEIFDRGNDGGSDPTNNNWTKYIQDNMLEKYNVKVEYQKVPRWTEVEELNNLLAAGDAPDVCVTYSYPTIQTYADMGGVVDLAGYMEEYKDLLPNIYDWCGDLYINWDKDPETGNLWAIEGVRAATNNLNTFVRKDWLDKLGLEAPTTTEEFYQMLCAFRDNAETLLGDDAAMMIPFLTTDDVGWYIRPLIMAKIDPDITDKDYYINSYDDRYITMDSTKEAVRIVNKWYNEDLVWKDFALQEASVGEDYARAGFVGAFCQNWDVPYRDGGNSYQKTLDKMYGEDAQWISVNCFEDKNGNYSTYSGGFIDRKVFLPATNDEVLASLLYLDFITAPETVEYLQIGEEGITHETLESGAVQTIAAEGDWIQNSGYNIDYTMLVNGLKLVDPEITDLSIAYSYAGGKPEQVQQANETSLAFPPRIVGPVNVGQIEAETGVGEALNQKRNVVYDTAVACAVEEFDQVWDSGMEDYMSTGGQAIKDERKEKWENFYGDAEMLGE